MSDKSVKVGDKVRLTASGRNNFRADVGRHPSDDESVGEVVAIGVFVRVSMTTPTQAGDGLWRFFDDEIEVIDD